MFTRFFENNLGPIVNGLLYRFGVRNVLAAGCLIVPATSVAAADRSATKVAGTVNDQAYRFLTRNSMKRQGENGNSSACAALFISYLERSISGVLYRLVIQWFT